MSEEHILFVGLGDWDIPQLQIASGLGYATIVSNRSLSAEGLRLADTPIPLDGQDVGGIFAFISAKGLADNISYIYSGTELALTVSLLAKALGIDWHQPAASVITGNKRVMRRQLEGEGVLVPRSWPSESLEMFLSNAELLEGDVPLVVKPTDGISSRGVRVVFDRRELEDAFKFAAAQSKSNSVIVEEFIEGRLHDVNGIMTSDGLIRLGLNDKKAGSPPAAVVVEASLPSTLSGDLQDEAYQVFERACRAVGLGPGPVKGDLIRDQEGRFMVLEVAPRLHGPLGSLYLIPNGLGLDPLRELLRWQRGEKPREHDVYSKPLARVVATAVEDPGRVTNSAGTVALLQRATANVSDTWQCNDDVPGYAIQKMPLL